MSLPFLIIYLELNYLEFKLNEFEQNGGEI